MKTYFNLFISMIFGGILFSQEISSINSGSFTSNSITYSVGEIFVNQEHSNHNSSGLLGVVSITVFYELDLDEMNEFPQNYFYPNPTSHFLYFKSDENLFSNFFIYNLSGQMVYTGKISNNKIDLTNLTPGIYFLKTDNSKINSLKIIKK